MSPDGNCRAGGVERGETFGQALEKELREEANIVLKGPPQLFCALQECACVAARPRGALCMQEIRTDGPAFAGPGNRRMRFLSSGRFAGRDDARQPSGVCRKRFTIWNRFRFGEGTLAAPSP
jgi:hypothetical protein